MRKVSSAPKEKWNITKTPIKRKRNKRKLQTKLSEFFRSSPLAGIDVSRDKSL